MDRGKGDFLKASSIAQTKFPFWKFCAETCVNNYIKTCESRKKLSHCVKNMRLVQVFPVLDSLVKKIAQILRYFPQSCDCMFAAFRNSELVRFLLLKSTAKQTEIRFLEPR